MTAFKKDLHYLNKRYKMMKIN